jgi:hypothetical protein
LGGPNAVASSSLLPQLATPISFQRTLVALAKTDDHRQCHQPGHSAEPSHRPATSTP